MKKSVAITIIALLFYTFMYVAQQLEYKTVVRDYSKILLLLEGGVNLSVSVHEELYQTHRAGVGINVRASMRFLKTELGIRGI
jgi:hypothetical protein